MMFRSLLLLWINNSIVVNSNREAIIEAYKFPEVSMICYDVSVPIEELRDVKLPYSFQRILIAACCKSGYSVIKG